MAARGTIKGSRTVLLLLGLLFGAPDGAFAQALTGRVNVTDGDSFELGNTMIRLYAIDAPEGRQRCRRGSARWACGAAAAAHLRGLVRGRRVSCRRVEKDDYERIVAVCNNGSVDLGEAMVSAGYALAYTRYGNDYVSEERAARAARRGIWASEFESPEAWRRSARAKEAAPASAGRRGGNQVATRAGASNCRIKGNINASGERIYHPPGSPAYGNTRIDESAGERWFCSPGEAERAGWRAPRL